MSQFGSCGTCQHWVKTRGAVGTCMNPANYRVGHLSSEPTVMAHRTLVTTTNRASCDLWIYQEPPVGG